MSTTPPIALLWEKLDNHQVKCNICNNRCILFNGQVSRCLSRKNINGSMVLTTYGLVSSIAIDPIEKKPLYHFYPGSKVLSIGGWGCNFDCLHCQNSEISQIDKKILENNKQKIEDKAFTPEQLVNLMDKHSCKGISWTYNEPTIWLEYTLDSAKLAKKNNYYTAYVTNGYMTTEALDLLAPYLDAYRVDLKSYTDDFYVKICGVKNWTKIYETALHAKKLGMHVETVTNIIPTKNDSEEELRKIAKWIFNNLGEDTPWHVTRFFPYNKLIHLPPTPAETIEKAVIIGHEEGLNFVYRGNVPGDCDTICPNCSTTGIQRTNHVHINTTKDGKCKKCGRTLNIRLK